MPRCFTTPECELILSGYSRHNYSNWSLIPAAIISLMSSFYNLWRHFRLTEEKLQDLRQLSVNQYLSIHITTVSIQNISFELILAVFHVPEPVEDCDVEFVFTYFCPKDVEWIGGYFESLLPNSECQQVSYQRSWEYNTDCVMDDGVMFLDEFGSMPLSKCKSLTELQFSIYFDVQQIKYAEYAQSPHMDNLSPLKGSGRYQWILEDEDLSELQQSWYIEKGIDGDISDDWDMALVRESDENETWLRPIYPFIPLSVCGFHLQVKGSYVIKYKINSKEEGEIESSFEDTQSYGTSGLSHFDTGITRDDIADALSITLYVQLEIVSILPEEEESDSEDSDSNNDWLSCVKKFGILMENLDQ